MTAKALTLDVYKRQAQTQREIDQKVVELVKTQHEKAIRILTENRAKLDELDVYKRQVHMAAEQV